MSRYFNAILAGGLILALALLFAQAGCHRRELAKCETLADSLRAQLAKPATPEPVVIPPYKPEPIITVEPIFSPSTPLKPSGGTTYRPEPSGPATTPAIGSGDYSININPEAGLAQARGTLADSLAAARNYYSVRFYRDSLPLSGGYVIVSDTVTQNQITSRSVRGSLARDRVTERVEVAAPPRGALYASVILQGMKGDPTEAIGGGLMYKTRRGPAFEVAALHGTAGGLRVQASYKFKIAGK